MSHFNDLAEQMGAGDSDDPREDRRDAARARQLLTQFERADTATRERHTIGAVTNALRRANGQRPRPTAEQEAARRRATLDAMRARQERVNALHTCADGGPCLPCAEWDARLLEIEARERAKERTR